MGTVKGQSSLTLPPPNGGPLEKDLEETPSTCRTPAHGGRDHCLRNTQSLSHAVTSRQRNEAAAFGGGGVTLQLGYGRHTVTKRGLPRLPRTDSSRRPSGCDAERRQRPKETHRGVRREPLARGTSGNVCRRLSLSGRRGEGAVGDQWVEAMPGAAARSKNSPAQNSSLAGEVMT